MATANEIFGMVGAAKAFSSASYSLIESGDDATSKQIRRLKQQRDEATTDKEKRKLDKKIKRLERWNRNVKNVENGTTWFLTKLMSYLDISIETLIDFISKLIVNLLPSLEVSVKLLLLSNIKRMLSCSIDPMIPDVWRVDGMVFNEALIDPRQILTSGPHSKWGKYNYFGTYLDGSMTSGFELPNATFARALDMNAFLWYARNSSRLFVSPNIVNSSNITEFFDDVTSETTLYNTHVFREKPTRPFIEGCTFKASNNANTTFLCEYVTPRGEMVIVPATDRWTGLTWYKDRTDIYGKRNKDTDFVDLTGKRYDNSKPLFNIEYLGASASDASYPEGNFRFRILPKPFSTAGGFIVDLENNVTTIGEAIGHASEELFGNEILSQPNYKFRGIQSPIPYAARFNGDGLYDKNGKYTVNYFKYTISEGEHTYDGRIEYGIGNVATMYFHKKSKAFEIVGNTVPMSDILTECYPGLTVYEFNYDYVVSMKLFDEKSIAINIIDSLMNINLPNPFKRGLGGPDGDNGDAIIDADQTRIDAYVDKLIENMIDNEDHEYTDCFYTFSNEDYDQMELKTANLVANGNFVTDTSKGGITEIYDILDAYDADATLDERIETISLALRKAKDACGLSDEHGNVGKVDDYATSVSNESSGSGMGFIDQLVRFLISAIVNAILTPKVLLLIQVNRKLMGQELMERAPENLAKSRIPDTVDILNGLQGLLKGVIREVVDTIHKEILRLILEKLSEMMAQFIKNLGAEYAMKWAALLKLILSCFKRNRSTIDGNANNISNMGGYTDSIQTIIDQIDRADIDNMVDEIIPQTNKC